MHMQHLWGTFSFDMYISLATVTQNLHSLSQLGTNSKSHMCPAWCTANWDLYFVLRVDYIKRSIGKMFQ